MVLLTSSKLNKEQTVYVTRQSSHYRSCLFKYSSHQHKIVKANVVLLLMFQDCHQRKGKAIRTTIVARRAVVLIMHQMAKNRGGTNRKSLSMSTDLSTYLPNRPQRDSLSRHWHCRKGC